MSARSSLQDAYNPFLTDVPIPARDHMSSSTQEAGGGNPFLVDNNNPFVDVPREPVVEPQSNPFLDNVPPVLTISTKAKHSHKRSVSNSDSTRLDDSISVTSSNPFEESRESAGRVVNQSNSAFTTQGRPSSMAEPSTPYRTAIGDRLDQFRVGPYSLHKLL